MLSILGNSCLSPWNCDRDWVVPLLFYYFTNSFVGFLFGMMPESRNNKECFLEVNSLGEFTSRFLPLLDSNIEISSNEIQLCSSIFYEKSLPSEVRKIPFATDSVPDALPFQSGKNCAASRVSVHSSITAIVSDASSQHIRDAWLDVPREAGNSFPLC